MSEWFDEPERSRSAAPADDELDLDEGMLEHAIEVAARAEFTDGGTERLPPPPRPPTPLERALLELCELREQSLDALRKLRRAIDAVGGYTTPGGRVELAAAAATAQALVGELLAHARRQCP